MSCRGADLDPSPARAVRRMTQAAFPARTRKRTAAVRWAIGLGGGSPAVCLRCFALQERDAQRREIRGRPAWENSGTDTQAPANPVGAGSCQQGRMSHGPPVGPARGPAVPRLGRGRDDRRGPGARPAAPGAGRGAGSGALGLAGVGARSASPGRARPRAPAGAGAAPPQHLAGRPAERQALLRAALPILDRVFLQPPGAGRRAPLSEAAGAGGPSPRKPDHAHPLPHAPRGSVGAAPSDLAARRSPPGGPAPSRTPPPWA